jgi:hypothetical protein
MPAVTGLLLGAVIGVISAVVLVALIQTVWGSRANDQAAVFKVVIELLALPTFILGGPWLAGRMLEGLDVPAILPYYLLSIAAFLCVPGIVILLWKLRAMGQAEALVGGNQSNEP